MKSLAVPAPAALAAALLAIALAAPLPARANTTAPRAPATAPSTAPQMAPIGDQASQLQAAALPPWMRDDGSSSDYPTPMPSDRSGEALNHQYRNGITAVVPPGAAAPPGFAPVPR